MDKKRIQAVIKRTAAELIGLIVAAIGWFLNVFSFVEKSQSIIIVTFGIVIWIIFAIRRTYIYEEKIYAFENARPNLIATPKCGVYPVNTIADDTNPYTPKQTTHSPIMNNPTPFFMNSVYGTPGLGEPPSTDELDYEKDNQSWFALVYFHNKPLEPTDNSVAKEVSATITYYDKDCNPKIKDTGISGRWWSNPEIGKSNKTRLELERTDIYPGPQGVILALACMRTEESAIYAYNNENHNNKDFQKREFALGLQGYHIRVVLAGIHLQETEFWFSVWRDTNSGELKIKIIQKPDCIR